MRAFPRDFIFGASSSAFQVEGSPGADGKGPSVWDEFQTRPGAVAGGDRADPACDHYRRWRGDVDLMAELGLDAYRFSIAWTRVLPDGTGPVNRAGLDFYSRLVDGLLEKGIRPFPTLFHWDLPLALQKKCGGFRSRDAAAAFGDFASLVARELGDRVKDWITINEPFEFACFGHLFGTQAPGVRDPFAFLPVLHHQLLAHGTAVRALRAAVPGARVGLALSWTPVHPASASRADAAAADRANALMNRVCFDPVLLGEYPREAVRGLFARAPVRPGDLELISGKIDFVGVNYYSREKARNNPFVPLVRADVSGKEPREGLESDGRTAMGWEVYPDGLSEILEDLRVKYGNPPVIVTEFGSAWTDSVEEGGRDGASADAGRPRVRDARRLSFLKEHLERMRLAREAGSDLRGAFVWSLTDNFEWSEGLEKRFGLVRVDYGTQERIVKDSGRWYRSLIATRDLDAARI